MKTTHLPEENRANEFGYTIADEIQFLEERTAKRLKGKSKIYSWREAKEIIRSGSRNVRPPQAYTNLK